MWINLVLIVGTTARLTRLVTRDTITRGGTDPLGRFVLYNRTQRRHLAAGKPIPAPARERAATARLWLLTLLNCDWCASMWLAALVTVAAASARRRAAATGHLPLWWTVPAGMLTGSYLTGWLAEHENTG